MELDLTYLKYTYLVKMKYKLHVYLLSTLRYTVYEVKYKDGYC